MARTGGTGTVCGRGRSAIRPGTMGGHCALGLAVFPRGTWHSAARVLYRMPLQSHARSRMDLQFAIRDEVVLRLAELYGRRPEEIDPDWGM